MFESGGRVDVWRMLKEAVDAADGLDLAGLPPHDALEQVREAFQALDRVDALVQRLVEQVHGSGASWQQHRIGTLSWLRHACHRPAGEAKARVCAAQRAAMTEASLAAFADGQINLRHIGVIGRVVSHLPTGIRRQSEDLLLQAATSLDPLDLARVGQQLLEAVGDESAAAAAQRRYDSRWLAVSRTLHGMVHLEGMLDSEAGEALFSALEPLTAPTDADDQRTADQRRADGLGLLAKMMLNSDRLPDSAGLRPHIFVTMDLDVLRGGQAPTTDDTHFDPRTREEQGPRAQGHSGRMHDHSKRDEPEQDAPGQHVPRSARSSPGLCSRERADKDPWVIPVAEDELLIREGSPERPGAHLTKRGRVQPRSQQRSRGAGEAALARTGPVNPETARRLACDATLIPVVLGGPSEVLDIGRATRTWPVAIRRAAALRDQGCTFPGCHAPLAHTDLHHLTYWSNGGPTSLENSAHLCQQHHRRLHEEGWRAERSTAGELIFTSPRGHQHLWRAPVRLSTIADIVIPHPNQDRPVRANATIAAGGLTKGPPAA